MGFGERLKELRQQAGLSQAELAAKAAMSKGGVANIEQGLRSPAWESVVALARALGVDVGEFDKAATAARTGKGRPKGKKKA